MTITEAHAMLLDRLGPGTYSIDLQTWSRDGKLCEVQFSAYANLETGSYDMFNCDSLEGAVLSLIAKAGGVVSENPDNNLDAIVEEAGRLAKDTDRALSIITGGQA